MNDKSCVGCKFLYGHGTGYSNWTWLDTDICCAKDKNPNLPADQPSDWNMQSDNWKYTADSRCELYSPGEFFTLDIDGEDSPDEYTNDEEAIVAICAHSGRKRRD